MHFTRAKISIKHRETTSGMCNLDPPNHGGSNLSMAPCTLYIYRVFLKVFPWSHRRAMLPTVSVVVPMMIIIGANGGFVGVIQMS